MDEPIRIALVDDHPVVREGLRMFLESSPLVRIAVDSASGEDALSQMEEQPCDVVLLDLVLGEGMDGVTVFDHIRTRWPQTAVLILTSYRDNASLSYLRQHGARGYLDKTVQPDDLLQAIRLLASGHSVWQGVQTDSAPDKLTVRENMVLAQLAQGFSNKEIAANLHISEKTVKVHISHILSKLGVYDRTQAVIHAYQMGLVRMPPDPR